MITSTHSETASNIEIIKQFYSALNQNDIDSLMNLLDEDITRVEFEGFPMAGTYKGLTEMRQHLIAGRSTWAEGACEPVDFTTAGNKLVVDVHVRVRQKNKTEWNEGQIADAFRIENGKIIEFHSFMEKEKAFEWAGIS